MKRKAALTLTATNFCNWLREKLPPAGRPSVQYLLANMLLYVDLLPVGQGPTIGEPGSMSKDNVMDALEWIFTSLSNGNSGNDWVLLLCHTLRVQAIDNLEELYSRFIVVPQGHQISPRDPLP